MDRVKNFKLVLWIITGLGAAVAVSRMLYGLGSTTNLSDGVPWGLWVGFDVMGGVALAAGGFVLTATVYIFKREEFHPIVRPAVLTAFLGYIAVIIGLLLDLGLPWHIWRPMVNWQHHSVLFEVAWCVMLYTTVLALEFSPVPLEANSRYARIRSALIRWRLPLVIIGIALSTLHQSSLGSLFLIMPHRLHPLWYSPILPILFFISAIGLGLMMVSLESLVTSYLYRRKSESKLLASLGVGARWVLMLYVVIRFVDLGVRGKIPHMFEGSQQSLLFWHEIMLAAGLPIIMLWIPRIRKSTTGQWLVSIMAVSGFVLNRISTAGLAQVREGLPHYVPSLTEIMVSAGIVAAAILAFMFAIEKFKVWEKPPRLQNVLRYAGMGVHAVQPHSVRLPFLGKVDNSMVFVMAAGIGFAMISGEEIRSRGVDEVPVHKARGGDTLWIDGNLDGFGAIFTHRDHMRGCFRGPSCVDCHDTDPVIDTGRRMGDSALDPTCVRCHHMNLPRDKNTSCMTCHRDMYRPTDAFGHDWHSSHTGANLSCADCHSDNKVKTVENAKSCTACHSDLVPEGSTIQFTHYEALGYVEAMHRLCINCHLIKAEIVENPDLARCVTCHPGQRDYVDAADIAVRHRKLQAKRVVLPLLK